MTIGLLENSTKESTETLLSLLEPVQTTKLILSFFQNEEQFINRGYGNHTSKALALKKEILLEEFTLENLQKAKLLALLNNFIAYLEVKGQERAEKVFKRYLWANYYFRTAQRLFSKYGVLQSANPMSSQTPEIHHNIPGSLFDFDFSKALHDSARANTVDQNRLWAKISNDFEWQKEKTTK